ncbi:NADH-ubiquinone oxidoreductase-F iron-sulfur binding region domain-containing protein [Kutzneria sp. 744]|uniref:NADH-ubiquinone oxidoreductase-F iron-sulfur binding region domain-containing protein n=1 Tax=Kutzneria sp. (strain 744) TaxID=345341 RepID=UPI0003EEBE38|nr:NADH-ubiquinone oxidoreductase-F iron-sulfur binding region domain-containing protein [Kutzneria sp. 744]EWM17403.1 NADH dehydrogenase I subunit F [Kutzneria sp. 744]
MDLRFLEASPSKVEKNAIDVALVGTDCGRDQLLPALHAANDAVGWISEGALNHICRRLSVPPAEAYGVATFYSLFSMQERPRKVVHVCVDLACKVNGAEALVAAQTDFVVRSPCLGVCERAPAALAVEAGGDASYLMPELPLPQLGDSSLRLLRRVGTVDPLSLDDYRAAGGYAALRNAFLLGPQGVIREVTDAKLMGRGGAAFPTGRKWAATAGQPGRPHYLVCNADESEPGTFKDRVLMEGDPFAVIEAMTVAAYATGCTRGYLYIRGEYPRAFAALTNAISVAHERGFLGSNIMGQPGFEFDVEIRRGAGAYICGEETAIFNSIEGFRGEPRSKPPFPVEKGLFGKPTVVNNVETLANVLLILTEGCQAFHQVGTPQSTGSKLFCVSGTVPKPGVYEVPFGTTLRELLELAGGVEDLRAVLLGGAAGGFLRADEIDLPLTMEDARAAGTTLGSGVVLVLDGTVDVGGFLLRIAEFFRDESCGQCVPCRIGTVRQEEALHRIVQRKGDAQDLLLLRDVGQVMRDSSICGLGQTAWNAIESAIDRLGVQL